MYSLDRCRHCSLSHWICYSVCESNLSEAEIRNVHTTLIQTSICFQLYFYADFNSGFGVFISYSFSNFILIQDFDFFPHFICMFLGLILTGIRTVYSEI